MPKTKPVHDNELLTALAHAEEASDHARAITRRLNSDTSRTMLADPLGAAGSMLAASRSLSEVAAVLLMRFKLQEQQRQIDELKTR